MISPLPRRWAQWALGSSLVLTVAASAAEDASEPRPRRAERTERAVVQEPAQRSTSYRSPITPPLPAAVANPYPGTISGPLVPHWSRELPGKPMTSAAHAERVRPVIIDQGILVGAASGDALYLLDRTDGGVIRSYAANTSVETEPFVDGDRVIFTDTGGAVWCYELAGELVWTYDTRAPAVTRPAVADDKVIITTVDDLIVALDRGTGALIWRYQQQPDVLRNNELALYAAPTPVLLEGRVLTGFSDGSLVAIDLDTGDVSWGIHVGEGRYPDIVAAPILNDEGTIFASGYFEPLIAYQPSTGVIWSLDLGAAARPLLLTEGADATLYHPGTDGSLRAINAKTGDVLWVWSSGGDGSLTAPQRTDAGLLVGSTSGTLALIEPKDGAELWRFQPMLVLEGISTEPALDGRQAVFVTNAGRIYSMLAPPPESPRPTVEWRFRRPDRDPSLVTPLPGPGKKAPKIP